MPGGAQDTKGPRGRGEAKYSGGAQGTEGPRSAHGKWGGDGTKGPHGSGGAAPDTRGVAWGGNRVRGTQVTKAPGAVSRTRGRSGTQRHTGKGKQGTAGALQDTKGPRGTQGRGVLRTSGGLLIGGGQAQRWHVILGTEKDLSTVSML